MGGSGNYPPWCGCMKCVVCIFLGSLMVCGPTVFLLCLNLLRTSCVHILQIPFVYKGGVLVQYKLRCID